MSIKIFWGKEKKRVYDQHVLEIGRLCNSPYYNLMDSEVIQLFDVAGTCKFWDEYRAMKKRHDEKRQTKAWKEHLVMIYNKLGLLDNDEAQKMLYGISIHNDTFPEKLAESMREKIMEESGEDDGFNGPIADED